VHATRYLLALVWVADELVSSGEGNALPELICIVYTNLDEVQMRSIWFNLYNYCTFAKIMRRLDKLARHPSRLCHKLCNATEFGSKRSNFRFQGFLDMKYLATTRSSVFIQYSVQYKTEAATKNGEGRGLRPRSEVACHGGADCKYYTLCTALSPAAYSQAVL